MEEFNAKKELKALRGQPRDVRQAQASRIRDNLGAQLEGLADLQAAMVDGIRQHPDASAEELYGVFVAHGQAVRLNSTQRLLAQRVLQAYVGKHLAVQRVRKEHPDDDELFETLFGRPPQGEVAIVEGPMTLYVRCFSPIDYAFIYHQKFADPQHRLNWHEIDAANMSVGASIPGSLIPGLEGTITAENTEHLLRAYRVGTRINYVGLKKESDTVRLHEEQHAIKHLFGTQAIRSRIRSENSQDWDRRFRAFLLDVRNREADERARDEILAYFKEGYSTAEHICEVLLRPRSAGGLYDYLADFRPDISKDEKSIKKIKEGLQRSFIGDDAQTAIEQPDVQARTLDLLEDVLLIDYAQTVRDGVAACFRLKDAGWSHEKIIGLLIHEPLMRWRKITERVLRKRVELRGSDNTETLDDEALQLHGAE